MVFLKSKKYYFGHRAEKGYLSAPFFGLIYLKSEIVCVFRSFNIPQFKLKLIGARAPKKLKPSGSERVNLREILFETKVAPSFAVA